MTTNKIILPVVLALLLFTFAACSGLKPFFDNCEECELNNEAGYIADENNQWHCCENVVFTSKDTNFLYRARGTGGGGSLNAKVGGILKSELDIDANTQVIVRLKEIQRWAAQHWKLANHCERHTANSDGDCVTDDFIKEVRLYEGSVRVNTKLDASLKGEIEEVLKEYDINGRIRFNDTLASLDSGRFFKCRVLEHDHPPCGRPNTVLNPEFWEFYRKAPDASYPN